MYHPLLNRPCGAALRSSQDTDDAAGGQSPRGTDDAPGGGRARGGRRGRGRGNAAGARGGRRGRGKDPRQGYPNEQSAGHDYLLCWANM